MLLGHSRPSTQHNSRLLAHGLARRVADYSHDNERGREGKSKHSLIEKNSINSNNKLDLFLVEMLEILA